MISNSLLAEEPLFCFIPGFKTWPEIEALPCKQDISTGETSQGIIMKNSIKLDIKSGEALEFEGRTQKEQQKKTLRQMVASQKKTISGAGDQTSLELGKGLFINTVLIRQQNVPTERVPSIMVQAPKYCQTSPKHRIASFFQPVPIATRLGVGFSHRSG